MEFDIYLDGQSCIGIGLFPVTLPSVPASKKQYKTYDVPGRDGSLYEDLGTYYDVEYPVQFNFIAKEESVESMFRRFKELLRETKEIKKNTDFGTFYKVKKVDISDLDLGSSNCIGSFTATFTIEPFSYLVEGKLWFDIVRDSDKLGFNTYEISKPTYRIVGEGVCTITVNGKSLTVNNSGTTLIDTDLMIAYRESGELVNKYTDGDFESLWLPEGYIQITCTSGFVVNVKPNWRCEL